MLAYCPTCEKDVEVIAKMFHVKLCPDCNKIISSDYPPYDKVTDGK